MSITITKQKEKKPEQLPQVEPVGALIDPSEMTLEQLADKYGELTDRVNAIQMNQAFAQLEEVTKQLQDRMAEFEPTEVLTIKGNHWLVEISAAAKNSRKLLAGAIPALQKLLGPDTFGKIAKVNITDVEKYCTPDQTSNLIDEDTGYSSKRKIVAKHIG